MKNYKIKSRDLNYNYYSMNRYDRDIVNSIPGHQKIHKLAIVFLLNQFATQEKLDIIDLGAGTGLSSFIIRRYFPKSHFDMVDFSKQMLQGAKKKMGNKNTRYFLADYSKMRFYKKYDVIISIIGFHHQSDKNKKKIFKKIFSRLKPNGVFIFGDLVTHRDENAAALNSALHYHHLVEKAENIKSLTEWARHHIFLNKLTPIENLVLWLKEVGFEIEMKYNRFNTALIIAKKVN